MLIAHTLEKVEDMDVGVAGGRHPVGLRDVPRVPRRRSSRHGTVLNFAAYIGHTPLRIYVMGDEASSRTATPDEIDADGRRSCARRWTPARAGFATSFAITHLGADGKPIPSRWSDRAELEALFRAVGRQPAAASSGSTASATSCTSTRSTTCSASSASR